MKLIEHKDRARHTHVFDLVEPSAVATAGDEVNIRFRQIERESGDRSDIALRCTRTEWAALCEQVRAAIVQADGLVWCERCALDVPIRNDRGDILCVRCGLVL